MQTSLFENVAYIKLRQYCEMLFQVCLRIRLKMAGWRYGLAGD